MKKSTQADTLLRNALRSNALFSGICGLLFLVAAPWLSGLLGSVEPLIVRAIGVSLLIFAVGLVVNASSASISRAQAWTAVFLDLTWVSASALIVALQILTTTGNWAVAIVADTVLIFAIFQALGIRRLARK